MLKSKALILWGYVILSALLLSVPFLVSHSGLLMLIAFLPLLLMEKRLSDQNTKHGWIFYYSAFFIWNLITTYWIYNATLPGAIAAIVLNAFQMSLIFAIFRWFKKKTNPFTGYLFLIIGWLAWEHFYFNAEISWPWLVLGNGFATCCKNIQWYEFTGTLGGSLWILLSNIFLFYAVQKRDKRYLAAFLILLIIPVSLSRLIYNKYQEARNPKEFVVLQPNIDPYNDKFGNMSQTEQDDKLFSIAQNAVSDSTDMVVAPETFTSGLVENDPSRSDTYNRMFDFLKSKKICDALFGATSYFLYPPNAGYSAPTYTARRIKSGWYDAFNTAVYLDSTGRNMFYHKSKLVVLVEFLPYPQYLKFLNSFIIDLGGATGSYGTQKERSVYTSSDKSIKMGTAVCYESIYGDYYREYVLNGANVMAIITNDGWWGNTPGYHQHLRYASLRAIETRRSIVRSANTGISALIDQRGDVIQKTEWWKDGWLRGNLNLNDKITFFVKYGDITGRAACYSLPLFLLLALAVILKIRVKGIR